MQHPPSPQIPVQVGRPLSGTLFSQWCQLLHIVPMYPPPTGPTGAEIHQTPPFHLAGVGQDEPLECEQNLRYSAMYWYQQDPGEGLRLIYYSTVERGVQRGDKTGGRSISPEQKGLFPLTMKLVHTSQTVLYLCSSGTPQGHCQRPPVLKAAAPTTASALISEICPLHPMVWLSG